MLRIGQEEVLPEEAADAEVEVKPEVVADAEVKVKPAAVADAEVKTPADVQVVQTPASADAEVKRIQ